MAKKRYCQGMKSVPALHYTINLCDYVYYWPSTGAALYGCVAAVN